jgi:hypothetical protein
MKHIVQSAFLFAVVCTGWNVAKAQKPEYYSLQAKNVKIDHAGFSKVEVIDARLDTAHLGTIQRGVLNRKGVLTFSQPLKEEMAAMAGKLISEANTKEEGTLLINIRKFYISERTTSTEQGLFVFKAGFYLRKDTLYRELFTVDTTYTIDAGLRDVTDQLLDTVPGLLGSMVQQAAGFVPDETVPAQQYTACELQHLAEIEKRAIPVYNVEAPKKGLYANVTDFMNNHPTREDVIIEHRKGFKRPFIYEMEANGKKGKEILRKYYFVVSDGEKMYISRPNNLYELTKNNGDFYYTGIGRDDADIGSVVVASALFGILGGAAAASHDTATFEYLLDHSSGKFIPIRKIKD